jgi:hypothetical protein
MMPTPYRHTQPGYLLWIALGAGLAVTLYLVVVTGLNPVAIGLVVLLALATVFFSSLTVEVDNRALEVWFGPRPIKRRIPLNEIRSARVVYNPWYYGWGIRRIPGGWLFNVSGTAAVELRLETDSRFRVGTDAPEDLARALEARGIPLLPGP